jgi:hypothetical protein
MKKTIFILTLFAIFATGIAQQNIKEPYYMIDFSVVNCKFEFQINKVDLLSMNVNGQMASNMPCNHLILGSGVQQLDIFVYPSAGETEFDDETELSVKLVLYDVVGGRVDEVIDDNIVSWEMNDNDKKETVISHTLHFNAQVPYQLTAWQNSTNLNTVENLRQKVETAYEKLGEMITKKQYDAFKNLMQEKEKRVVISMYLDEKESERRMDGLIEEFENGFEFVPLSGAETMHIYADGKLVCLKTEDGESALRFLNKETDDEIYLDIMLHLKKGDTELTVSP